VGEEVVLEEGAWEGRVRGTGCYRDEGDEFGGDVGDGVVVG
jgi:hypothetical protein